MTNNLPTDGALPETDDPFVQPMAIEEIENASSLSLFEGDEGGLTLAQRQCLVVVLKNYLVTAERNPNQWDTLLADTRLIKARLNDLFLDLRIDRDRRVAYKVQVRSEVPGRFPPLLREASYSREETILLVFVRQRYNTERAGGQDAVVVDRQECLDAVTGYRPAHATDVVGDLSRADKALESLRSLGVLVRTADEDRFAISPVIESLLPLDRLRTLVDWLAQENSPTAPHPGRTDEEEST